MKVGPLYLYFGCRNEDDGNLYAEETSQLTHIITGECRAFSRPIQGKKVTRETDTMFLYNLANNILLQPGEI